MLRPFAIRSKTLWPPGRRPGRSNSRRHGLLLRTKRHTATGQRSQVLVAAVNRHMPATPAWGNQLRIKDANEVTSWSASVPDDTKNMARALRRKELHLEEGASPAAGGGCCLADMEAPVVLAAGAAQTLQRGRCRDARRPTYPQRNQADHPDASRIGMVHALCGRSFML